MNVNFYYSNFLQYAVPFPHILTNISEGHDKNFSICTFLYVSNKSYGEFFFNKGSPKLWSKWGGNLIVTEQPKYN